MKTIRIRQQTTQQKLYRSPHKNGDGDILGKKLVYKPNTGRQTGVTLIDAKRRRRISNSSERFQQAKSKIQIDTFQT